METPLNCPQCGKPIGDNDFLTVGRDSTGNGTLWIRHYISSDVPTRTTQTPKEMWRIIDDTPLDISYRNIREYCGSAGFHSADLRPATY